LTTVVVLPTPPFWFAQAMIWPNQVPISVVQNKPILAFGAVARFGGWLLKQVLPTRARFVRAPGAALACLSASRGYLGSLGARLLGAIRRRRHESSVRCLWAVCRGAPSEGPPPRSPAGAPVLVLSSRWSLPGAARYSEGPPSSWSEFDGRATADSAGTAGARRVFEVASRRLWAGGTSVVLLAPSAALASEFHVKHRRLAALDSIRRRTGANGGFGSRCCT
jgi:hypothetical protein